MAWFGPKLQPGGSIVFRRGAFVSTIGLAAVVVVFATVSGANTDGMHWPVMEVAVMGIALAALPVAFFAAGIRVRMEPGETRPIHPRSQDYRVARVFWVFLIPFLSLAFGLVALRILPSGGSGSDNTLIAWDNLQTPADWLLVAGVSLGIFLGLWFILQTQCNRVDCLFLTNRRVLRFTPGFWSGRLEVLALADVAEFRESPLGITLIATSCDAMRRLRQDGSTKPAGIDRLDLPLTRFRFPGAGGPQYDRAVRLLGREPLRWHAPDLPRDVGRLVSLEAKFPVIVPVLSFVPMLALGIAVAVRLHDAHGVWHDAVAVGLLSTLIPLGLVAAGCYLRLLLAARKLTPGNTALFLRATLHPDWGPGGWPRTPYIAARRAALKRRERIVSWLAGRPVRTEDAPGPEAYGGGWRA